MFQENQGKLQTFLTSPGVTRVARGQPDSRGEEVEPLLDGGESQSPWKSMWERS